MDTDRYPHAVAAYLNQAGWETSGTQVEASVFAIVARQSGSDGEQRLVTLVVADPDATVERKHLKYLLKAGRKKDADRVCVTTQGTIATDAETAVDQYDIEILDSETVVAAVSDDDGSGSDAEDSAAAADGPREAESAPEPDHPSQRDRESGTTGEGAGQSAHGQHQQPQQPQQPQQDPPQQQRRHAQQSRPQHGPPPRERIEQYVERLQHLDIPADSGQRLRRAVTNVPLVGGLFRGVGIYFGGLVFAAVLYVAVLGNNVESIPGFPMLRRGLPQFLAESAWLFYSAQGVELVGSLIPGTETALGFAVEQGERLAEAYTEGSSSVWLGFRLLYLVVPYLLFVESYRLVWNHYSDEDSLLDQAVGGTAPLVGYLPLVVAGSTVFGGSVGGQSLSISVLALVGMGALQPAVFGGLGGLTAGVFRDTDARLARGGYYGLAAFAVALVATGFLVFFGSAGGTGTLGLALTGLVVLPYAASFSLPPTFEGAVPGLVLSLVVVGVLALAGAALTRHHRNTGNVVDAAATGATVAMGFASGLFASLFVVLSIFLALDADQLDTTMDGLGFVLDAGTVHPVSTIVVGGILVPMLVGGGVGVYLAQAPETATPDGQPVDD
jgi:hypothetical protein